LPRSWFLKTFIFDYESPIDYILVFAGPVGKLAKWGVKALKVADNVADASPIVNVVAHTDDCAKAPKILDGAKGGREPAEPHLLGPCVDPSGRRARAIPDLPRVL
jgi:hypothetical protein